MKQREEIAALERGSSSHALASRRHRAVKRFQRACQYAELLSNIAREIYKMPQALLTASAAFQIQIYLQYMRGTLAFVKASSPGATAVQANINASPNSTLQPLSHAYVLLEVYGQSCHQATEEAIAFELLDELEPMIRFCAYKAGTSQNETPAEIAKDAGRNALEELEDDYHFPGLLAQLAKDTKLNRRKSKQEPETVQHLSWRDIDVPIRSAELADTLGRVNKAIQDICSRRSRTDSFQRKDKSETSMLNRFHSSINTFDRALYILIDAENKARKLVDDNTTALARAHSSRFEIAARPLTLVHSYILFHLLATRLQRDNLLIGQTLSRLAKREAKVTIEDTTFGPTSMRVKRRRMKLYPTIIKLLDGMVQSLERMRLLPVVEDDSTDLAEQVEASLASVKARR